MMKKTESWRHFLDILFVRPSLQMNLKLTISVCSSIPIIHPVTAHTNRERIQVPKMNVFEYKVAKNADNTESSTVGVHYMVTHNTFARGKVKVSSVKLPLLNCQCVSG